MSCGRKRRPAGISAAPVVTSSPRWMTLAPDVSARKISTTPATAASPPRVCSIMTTASAPSGRKPPVEMPTAWPAATVSGERRAHRHDARDAQDGGRLLGRGADVVGAHGVTVHDRARVHRQILGRGEWRRQHAAARFVQPHDLGADRRRLQHDPPRVSGGDQVQRRRLPRLDRQHGAAAGIASDSLRFEHRQPARQLGAQVVAGRRSRRRAGSTRA